MTKRHEPSLDDLIADVRREADPPDFPVDRPSTRKPARTRSTRSSSPARSTPRSASSAATWARTRSPHGQPLIGAGGRLVRAGLLPGLREAELPPKADRTLESVLDFAPADEHGPVQAAGQQGVSRVGEGAVPAVRGRAARRLLGGGPGHHPRDRGVPVVRPLRRARGGRGLLAPRRPLRGRVPVRARPATTGRRSASRSSWPRCPTRRR